MSVPPSDRRRKMPGGALDRGLARRQLTDDWPKVFDSDPAFWVPSSEASFPIRVSTMVLRAPRVTLKFPPSRAVVAQP